MTRACGDDEGEERQSTEHALSVRPPSSRQRPGSLDDAMSVTSTVAGVRDHWLGYRNCGFRDPVVS